MSEDGAPSDASRSRAAGSRIVDRFREGARSLTTMEALSELVQSAARELGFDHFALLHHATVGGNRTGLIRIDDYPADWEDELVKGGFLQDDPVHKASIRTHVGFTWSELGDHIRLSARHRAMLARAADFGIGDGFTVPINIPGEPGGSCSFAVRPGKVLPLGRLACAEQVGLHAFDTARRLSRSPFVTGAPRLSRREQQCLRLVAAGKTDWEVAAILGISAETARQYVKRARLAYNVVSRAQLVACGLRDALISFDEAIPPNGRM